mgnify:CR=1 FL=1
MSSADTEKYAPQVATHRRTTSAILTTTKELIARGRKRIGINMLLEVLRWNYYMKTDDPNSDFKINNNYEAYYARLFEAKNTRYSGFFRKRTV